MNCHCKLLAVRRACLRKPQPTSRVSARRCEAVSSLNYATAPEKHVAVAPVDPRARVRRDELQHAFASYTRKTERAHSSQYLTSGLAVSRSCSSSRRQRYMRTVAGASRPVPGTVIVVALLLRVAMRFSFG